MRWTLRWTAVLVVAGAALVAAGTSIEAEERLAAKLAARGQRTRLARKEQEALKLEWARSGAVAEERPAPPGAGAARTGDGRAQPAAAAVSYETKWFTQLVDHFSFANQDTFQQRYLVNARAWCGRNCPILFYCGNEGDIEVFANNTGFMWENADKLHAMLVFAEHRFYGRSFPYQVDPRRVAPNETAALGYLSSEQALADYARLIYHLRTSLFEAQYSPVVAVGGSYGGMLAAWLRMKYPNSVQGALAGSAPILQFPAGDYECGQFSRIVTRDYENYSLNCSQAIAKSWQILRQFGGQAQEAGEEAAGGSGGAGGLAKLSDAFNTCQPLTGDDVEPLIELLNAIWVNMAMTDYANEASFLSRMPALPIRHVCAQLDFDPLAVTNELLVERIAKASQVYTNYTGTLKCLDARALLYDPMDTMWDFQACTEMVMPICSDGVNDMFEPAPWNLTAFAADCRRRWGVRTQPEKVWTLYGKRADVAQTGSNIIFSTCSRDPWSAGCPQEGDEKRGLYALKIPNVCHHEDLRFSGPNDGREIKQARQKELNIITDWIQKHYEQLKKSPAAETLIWSKPQLPAANGSTASGAVPPYSLTTDKLTN